MSRGETLRVEITTRQGTLDLDIRFMLPSPWTCLFGVSGSGKTTILRAIAGFVTPDAGRIELLGDKARLWLDTEAGVWVPAHQRGVRSAAQQAFLFPGTVRKNVAYGLDGAAEAGLVREVLELFRLSAKAEAAVEGLSGGERQRVSLARAVAAAVGDPRVGLLLLDEPFAGMDAGLRNEVAGQLRDWLGSLGMPVLSVSHDVSEVFLLRAEVIRIGGGRVEDQGAAEIVLEKERIRLLALIE